MDKIRIGVCACLLGEQVQEVVESYRARHVPLISPVTIFSQYVRKYKEPFLSTQLYLNPQPVELQLRNHVY